MDRAPQSSFAVAEIQGLYGPFSFPERLLQKIWLRGDFDRSVARTVDGRRIVIRHPGRWNLLGGPDFRGARIGFEAEAELDCDVELHLHASDWVAHGHAADAAYAGVGLHVVLFPPEAGHVTRGAGGHPIPVLALLPLLFRDLEEYAADDAVESMAGRASARIPDELGKLAPAELITRLRRYGAIRWHQKVHFARLRLQRLGWEGACHAIALEILGFRYNRVPMLRLAGRWPLVDWASGRVDPEDAFAQEQPEWSLQGVRPANHPRLRLQQYSRWARERPDWPERLKTLLADWPELPADSETREIRRRYAFSRMRELIVAEVCGRAVGGSRVDNLVCDGFLPLASAHTQRELLGCWSHWFAADLPTYVSRSLRELAVFDRKGQPASQGLSQGFLGWWIEHENRTASS